MCRVKGIRQFIVFIGQSNKRQKQANAEFDKRFPMNAYPLVYEADEQMRFNIALAILGSGVGLVYFAAQNFSKSALANAYAVVFGGAIIFLAFMYLVTTASRLRYQNPGEAQLWYISESGRRNTYDFMVEMFWDGIFFGVEVSLPLYLITNISNHYLGIFCAMLEFILVNAYVTMMVTIGLDNDRKTGNLKYNHNLKMHSAKEEREPFDAPPVKRN